MVPPPSRTKPSKDVGVYHHKSGSQKRKEKKDRDEKIKDAVRGQPTLLKFCTTLHKDPGNQVNTQIPSASGGSMHAPTDDIDIAVSHTGEDAPVDLDIEPSSISDAALISGNDIPTSSMSDDNSEPIIFTADNVQENVTPIIAPNVDFQPGEESVKSTIQHHVGSNDFDIGTVETTFCSPEKVREVNHSRKQKITACITSWCR